jgi:hypothetical protein
VIVVDPEGEDTLPTPEREPNDRRAQAQVLEPDVWVQGTLSPRLSDEDWYRVSVVADDQVVSVVLTGMPDVDSTLTVFDAGGKRVLALDNVGPGRGEALPNFSRNRGSFYLVVRAARDKKQVPAARTASGKHEGHYRIRVSLRAREEGEEGEPNGTPKLATALKLGGEAFGYLGWRRDVDWYRVSLDDFPADGLLRVELDGVDQVRAVLELRDSRGRQIQRQGGGPGDPIALTNLDLPSGSARDVVYVAVRARQGYNGEARYHLGVSQAVRTKQEELEPNETSENATPLGLGETRLGQIGSSTDRDVYVTAVARPTPVRVELLPAPGLDAELALLDQEGAQAQGWRRMDSEPAGKEEVLPVVWLTPPRRYLQVKAAKWNRTDQSNSYRLTVRPLTGTDWEREPNGSPGTATVVGPEQREAQGYLFPGNDTDYFRISAWAPTLHVAGQGPLGIRLALKAIDTRRGVAVGSALAPSSGAKVQLSVAVEQGVSYLIRVDGDGAVRSSRSPYKLRFTASATPAHDAGVEQGDGAKEQE